MPDPHGPRKVLILDDNGRTVHSLIATAISRSDRLEVLWARTLEEATGALNFYGGDLSFIVLGDVITDGPTVDFAKYVQETGFAGIRIRIGTSHEIELEQAGFLQRCPRIELPSYLLDLVTTSFSPSFGPPPP